MPIGYEDLKNDILLFLDYYSEEELQEVVEEAIKEYNQKD